jgi:hypothetical protein
MAGELQRVGLGWERALRARERGNRVGDEATDEVAGQTEDAAGGAEADL